MRAFSLALHQMRPVVIGASRPEHLAGNLAAVVEFSLTEEELVVLDALDPSAPIYPDPRWLVPSG